jgi:hypothetical protein
MVKLVKIQTELLNGEVVGLVLNNQDLDKGIKENADIAVFSPKEIENLKDEGYQVVKWIAEAKKLFGSKIEFKEEKKLAYKRKQLLLKKNKKNFIL